MRRPRLRTLLLAAGIVLVLLAAAAPWIIAGYWRVRSSNAVRRGVVRAQELGCFSCHGELGQRGIPIPGSDENAPEWGGGVWMMYVKTEQDVRRYIAQGAPPSPEEPGARPAQHDHAEHEHSEAAIRMPAFGDIVSEADLKDLVAMFKAVSGMVKPAPGTAARSGYDLARQWRCFSCHGPAGSGGLPNPGSFAGFVPGWYGADFEDLVRSREEFDDWILEGETPRLSNHPIAKYFLKRQTLHMPAYHNLTREQLDELWAYVQWLDETDGGHAGEIASW